MEDQLIIKSKWKKIRWSRLMWERSPWNEQLKERYTGYWQPLAKFTYLRSIRPIVTSSEIFYEEIKELVLSKPFQFIGWNQIKIIEVPHIEGLRIPDLLAFARKHWDIDLYLPNYDWEKYPSRAWICNIGMNDCC